MPRRWTTAEEQVHRKKLVAFYVDENKTISEIADILHIAENSVYDRLVRLGIPSQRTKKSRCNNQHTDIQIPTTHSTDLAEFVGCLLGDGHLSPTQVTVALGAKDRYAPYVLDLIHRIFGIHAKQTATKRGYCVIYFGSTAIVRWFREMGLVRHKVKSQVDIPTWIMKRKQFMRAALRGLFDTDGSVYKLRWGLQISFCNRSLPLLQSVQRMLKILGFHPSNISGFNIYLTRRADTARFFREIGFGNQKHVDRYLKFNMGASHSGNCSAL